MKIVHFELELSNEDEELKDDIDETQNVNEYIDCPKIQIINELHLSNENKHGIRYSQIYY